MHRVRGVFAATAGALSIIVFSPAGAHADTNHAPVASAIPGGPLLRYVITEGDSLTLDASESSDLDGDALTYAWDLDGDNEFDDATGATPTLSAYDLEGIMFADGKNLADGPANTVIAVQVYDQHNPPVFGYAALDVSNATPSGTVTGDTTVTEGSPATIGIENATDAGPLDVGSLRYFFDTDGDGVPNASGEAYGDALDTPSVDYFPEDNGTLHLTAGVVDKDGSFARYTRDVIVTNVAPTATLSADGPVVEGSDAHVTFSDAFDPSNADTGAGFRYAYDVDGDNTWDIGDGTYGGGTEDATAAVPTDDVGTIPVRAAIIDKDGGVSTETVDVVVTNAAPAVSVTGPGTTPTDSALTFELAATTGTTPTAAAAPVAAASSPAIVDVVSAGVAPRCLRASVATTRSIKLRYRLSSAAQIRVSLKRVKGSTGARTCPPPRAVKQATSTSGSYSAIAALRPAALLAKGQTLSPGAYLLKLSVLDAAGKPQSIKHVRLWVLKST
jgi:hypothetical protein